VHRPAADWDKAARRNDPASLEGRVYGGLCRLIALRKAQPAFSGGELEVVDTGNAHVLGFVRSSAGQRLLVLANFSERQQTVAFNQLRLYGLSYRFRDLVTGAEIPLGDFTLEPYRFACLEG
jgi:glycosidase